MLYGGARHLAMVPQVKGARHCWPSPMAPTIERILGVHRRQQRVAVLASGDPMLYGVGVTLTRHLEPSEFFVFPQVSASSLACARLGWAISDVLLISVVSRPIERLHRELAPGRRLVLYSENGATPAAVAALLQERGFGLSKMIVFEHLGGPSEARTDRLAAAWGARECRDLNLIAIECVADAGTGSLCTLAGLPDAAFETDGQLTKREVRAATLAQLAPLPGETLWDVGAGTGSIAIEWMRTHPSCSAIAFEQRGGRARRIAQNARTLGVPSLEVREGTAPAILRDERTPDAIFVGGGLTAPGMFDACWSRLPRGGRFVANAVTLASEAILLSLHRTHRGELVRISIDRAEAIGDTVGWRPLMPVLQWSAVKP